MLKLIFLTFLLITTTITLPNSSVFAQSKNTSAQVKIFVASWCVHCRELEQFLHDQGIAYLKLDVEKDPEGRKRYQELGGGGVPMIIIGKSVLRGFDKAAILELLEKPKSRSVASAT